MRKADLVTTIAEKTGVPKVDVLVTLEEFFKEVKQSLSGGENVYIRGFGSFVIKKRAKKIGRIAKKYNVDFGIPKKSSNRTKTTPSKNAEISAPNPSTTKSFLGFCLYLLIKSFNI